MPVVPVVTVVAAFSAPAPEAPPDEIPREAPLELVDPRRPTELTPSDEADEPGQPAPLPIPPSETVVAAPMLVAPMADLSESIACFAC